MSGENVPADISPAVEVTMQSSKAQTSAKDESSVRDAPSTGLPKEIAENLQQGSLPEESIAPQENKACDNFAPPGCRLKTEKVPKPLTFPQKIIAGSGHVLNDFCASMWFFYLLFYLEKVVGFSSSNAAILMLFGQIIDGLATPLIGLLADRPGTCWPCRVGYGKFKTWHLAGAILVCLSFPFVFSRCLACSTESSELIKAIYYAPFIAIFQIGWAASQISHLALIPKLDHDVLIRTELLSIRYGFTISSNVIVFLITWLKLGFKSLGDECVIDVESGSTFRDLGLISVGIGIFFAIWFHLLVVEPDEEMKERQATPEDTEDTEKYIVVIEEDLSPQIESDQKDSEKKESRIKLEGGDSVIEITFIKRLEIDSHPPSIVPTIAKPEANHEQSDEYKTEHGTKGLNVQKDIMTIKDWLKLPQFYVIAFLYTSTRLSVNLTQVYMPLYVIESLRMTCSAIASVPLTMYCSGFIVAMLMKSINKYCGRQLAYFFGAILCVVGSLLILTLEWRPGSFRVQYGTYGVAVLLGGGASAILVTSLSITADLIGDNVENGAFIYGSMSFCDKLSCGLVILLINSLNPCQRGEIETTKVCQADAAFYSNVLGYSSGGCALLGALGVIGLSVILCIQNKRRYAAAQF